MISLVVYLSELARAEGREWVSAAGWGHNGDGASAWLGAVFASLGPWQGALVGRGGQRSGDT